MKKNIMILLIFMLVIMNITACKSGDTDELQKKVDSLEATVTSLQTDLDTVTKERDQLNADYANAQQKLEELTKEKEIQEGDATVVVVDKINIPQDINKGTFSNRVEFNFSLTNNTDKDIKGIQGDLAIQDLFGESIMDISCDFVGNTIKPKETIINKDLGFDVNEFIDYHSKVYTTDFEDLKFEYTIKKIIFTDGTVKE